MTITKRMFRISENDLLILMNAYKITDTQTGNSTATFIGKYLKKSFKTGMFEITRTGLLREATWARKNGFIEWGQVVSKWAELAEVPV
jgi:hypothetical protein|uniref:Uncharacterized protein n=1 Tax=viral metagenome TaxID=1070528 RepID=A0A6C0DI19_9ZZZZ